MSRHYSIRTAILVYSFLFTGGLALAITTFLTWRLGKLSADLHERDLGDAVTTAESFIEEELRYRLRALEDYSSFPALTQGVLNPTEHQSDIISFMSVLSAKDGGESAYTLLDFSGGLIHSTKVGWQASTGLRARAAPVLEDQGRTHVHLLLQGDVGRVEMFVPVCPGGRTPGMSAEGLFIYEFPVTQLVGDLTALKRNDIALRLNSLDGSLIWKAGEWRDDSAIQRTDRFEDLDMEIQVQFDDTAIGSLRRQAFVDTLRLLLLPALAFLALAIWSAQRLFGIPMRRLEQAARALGAGEDVSLEKDIPEASLSELHRLNQAFVDMRDQIHERDQQLLRSNHELERFAYVAAHDLREPLRTISNMLGLIEDESGDKLPHDLHQYLEMARTRSDRMQGMLADLLTMSRLHVDLQEEPVDLNQVAGDVREALRSKIETAGARVDIEPLPTVRGSANLLALMLQNLVDNALKFAKPDTPPEIRITGKEEAGEVQLQIADKGIGFKPEYADRIFEVFSRLNNRQAYAGSGIGLALVQRIVELHRGKITTESAEGEGALFQITLPAQPTSQT